MPHRIIEETVIRPAAEPEREPFSLSFWALATIAVLVCMIGFAVATKRPATPAPGSQDADRVHTDVHGGVAAASPEVAR